MSEPPHRSQRINHGNAPTCFEDFIMPIMPREESTTPNSPCVSASNPNTVVQPENLRDMKHAFKKKIEEMNAEFKRQLHQLQSLMLSNQTSLQTTIRSSMDSLLQEILSSQTNQANTMPLSGTSAQVNAAVTANLHGSNSQRVS